MKENKSRGSLKVLKQLEDAETYCNTLEDAFPYDTIFKSGITESKLRQIIYNKTEAYNKCHELRRLYYDRY